MWKKGVDGSTQPQFHADGTADGSAEGTHSDVVGPRGRSWPVTQWKGHSDAVQPPRPADSAAAATWPHLQQYKAPRCAARRARASGVVTHLHRIRLGSLLAKRVRLILGHRHAAAAAWSGRAGGRAGCPQRDAPVPSPTGARRQRGAASAQSRCPAMETHARVPAGPAQRAGRSQHAMSGKRRAPSPLAAAAVAAADRLASFLPRGILACGRALGSQALRARENTTPPARRARRPAGAVLKPSNNGSNVLTKPNHPPRGGRPRTAQPGPLEHSPRPGPVRSAELLRRCLRKALAP